jgi:hypothetical protein
MVRTMSLAHTTGSTHTHAIFTSSASHSARGAIVKATYHDGPKNCLRSRLKR